MCNDKDRRQHERILIQARASIEAEDLANDGLLMDFSARGLGLLIDHHTLPDIGQKLCLNLETGSRPTAAEGIIKWVRKLKEGKLFDYAVGIELVDLDDHGYGSLLRHAQS